jgi:hypothetical protein
VTFKSLSMILILNLASGTEHFLNGDFSTLQKCRWFECGIAADMEEIDYTLSAMAPK